MPTTPTRPVFGFIAGALSHVVFQGGLSVVYYAAGLIPGLLWSLEPQAPLGVPRTVHFAFWAGLWGIAYSIVAPSLIRRFGSLVTGLIFGVAALLVRWFVVLPLQGLPAAEGFQSPAVWVFVGFHLIFGLGLALIYSLLVNSSAQSGATAASTLRS